jgi:hypothetical protein
MEPKDEEPSGFEKEHQERKKIELEKERKFWQTQPVPNPKETSVGVTI